MPIIDSIPNDSNKSRPKYVATYLLDTLVRAPFYFTDEISSEVRIGPRIVETRGGSCLDLCDMLVYIYRALGIPCGIDYMPMRGNNSAPHYMNFIEDVDGQCYYYSMYYAFVDGDRGYDNAKNMLPSSNYDDVFGKMFRQTFSVNRQFIRRMKKKVTQIPSEFINPCYVDVTNIYAGNDLVTVRIEEKQLFSPVKSDEIVYLT